MGQKAKVTTQSTFIVRNNFNEENKESTHQPTNLIVMLLVVFALMRVIESFWLLI